MEAVTLEDNKEYVILDNIEIDGIKYLYLAHLSDPEKRTACIRKLVDNNTNIAGLDTEEEYIQMQISDVLSTPVYQALLKPLRRSRPEQEFLQH